MKTVMDAVNELMGSVGGICYGSSELYIAFHNDTATYNLVTLVEYRVFCGDFELVCSVSEFNDIVTELSHAPWIKGVSLEEYQAADKEVLKMENKTVEVDGMVYEIGKWYEFSNYEDNWEASKLDAVEGSNFVFLTSLGWMRFCREVKLSVGTITPAPVKLVNGEAYSFSFEKVKLAGLYFDRMKAFVCLERQVQLSMVEPGSIVHLTPKSK